MATFRQTMEGYGYIAQTTPAGRTIMVNPAAYPLSAEFLANEDDYADEYYDSWDAEQRALDEDLGYEYDDRFELED